MSIVYRTKIHSVQPVKSDRERNWHISRQQGKTHGRLNSQQQRQHICRPKSVLILQIHERSAQASESSHYVMAAPASYTCNKKRSPASLAAIQEQQHSHMDGPITLTLQIVIPEIIPGIQTEAELSVLPCQNARQNGFRFHPAYQFC